MFPALNKGDLLIAKSGGSFSVGQIVTFKSPIEINNYITHRIVRENLEEETSFNTKGDNNSSEDPWQITPDMIVGRLSMSLPLIGYPILFLKSSKIYIFMLAGLTLLIGFIEINLFGHEAAYEWERKNSNRFYRMIKRKVYQADRFLGRIYRTQNQS
jgi:signal peptidase